MSENEETGVKVSTPEDADISEAVADKFDDTNKRYEMFLKCQCGHRHFRHAGYMESAMPWHHGGETKVDMHSHQVMVCVKSKHCYIRYKDKFVDVTDEVDLKAWKKAEKKLQKATGPGGEC